MDPLVEDLLKLGLAVVVGGAIGAEREYRDKSAGFRTIILICVGATLFTIYSSRMSGVYHDPTRISANIVVGIGFLGAGVIIRTRGRVTGLTTAAAIWFAAALGMGIGGGQYALALIATAVLLFVLWLFPAIEQTIDNLRETHYYQITCRYSEAKLGELEALFDKSNLFIRSHTEEKSGDDLILMREVVGPATEHRKLREKLFSDPDVTGVKL